MDRFEILKLPEDYIPCYALQLPPKTSNEEKQAIIANLLSTQEGRQRLAASMAQPLRERMDYDAITRQVFIQSPPTFINCTMTVS